MRICLRALCAALLLLAACGKKEASFNDPSDPESEGVSDSGLPVARARSDLSRLFLLEGSSALDLTFKSYQVSGCLPQRTSKVPEGPNFQAWYRCRNATGVFWGQVTLNGAHDISFDEAVQTSAPVRAVACPEHMGPVVAYDRKSGVLTFECDYPSGADIQSEFEAWQNSIDKNRDGALNTAEVKSLYLQHSERYRSFHYRIMGNSGPGGNFYELATGMRLIYLVFQAPRSLFDAQTYRTDYRNEHAENQRCMTYVPPKGCFETPLNGLGLKILFQVFVADPL